MRIALIACIAGLSLALPAATVAQSPAPSPLQGTVDPATGRPSLKAKGLRAPSEGWTDADRSADAVAKGTAALESAAKAYREAKQLSDRAEVKIHLPDGEQNEVIDMRFGEGNDFLVNLGSMQAVCAGGSVHFVPDQPEDRYLTRKVEGSGHASMVAMMGAFSLPVPDLALRQPLPGMKLADAFASAASPGQEVKGSRTAAGMTEVLLAGRDSESVVTIDPASGFVRRVTTLLTPAGLPEGVKIGFEISTNPSAAPLAAPIAFDAGKRRAVASLEEMFADTAPAPNATVAAGAAAPVAVLTDLDGKPVDIGAMKGKVVVIDFWASWCGPCRRGLPLLQQFADEMKGNDKVAVFAVNVWEQCKPEEVVGKVRDTWDKLKLSLPVLLDRDAKLISQYGFDGIPATIVIGPDGKLVSSHMGFAQDLVAKLRGEVTKALGTGK
jgi:thiol-disulfide isomerase/thioredoxin